MLNSIQKGVVTAIAIIMYVGIENTSFTDNANDFIIP